MTTTTGTELDLYSTTDGELAAYLDEAATEDSEYEDLAAAPWSDYGVMKMNKGDSGFSLEFAGKKLRPESVLVTLLGRKNYYARRALFEEGGQKPLCSTPLVDPGRTSRSTWIGKWVETQESIQCSECEHSNFSGACRETRLAWFVCWEETPTGKLFQAADVPFRFSVPLTSIASMDAMIKRAKLLTTMRAGKKVPVPIIATIWKFSSEVIKKQGFTFSRLVAPEITKRMPNRDQFIWLNEVSDALFMDLERDRREHTMPEGTDGRIDPDAGTDRQNVPLGPDGQPIF